MHIPSRVPVLAAVAAIVIAVVTYTGASVTPQSAVAKNQRHSWISMSDYRRAKSAGGLVFISEVFNPSSDGEGAVDIFPATNPTKPIGQIAGNIRWPTALAVDQHGDLYVYNSQVAMIFEYKPPYTGAPVRSLNFIGCCLSGNELVVDSNDTLYAVGNHETGAITMYAKNATISTPQVNSYLPIGPNSIALDGKGNIFGTYDGRNAGGVFEYKLGGIPSNLLISLTSGSGTLLFDRAGNLVVANTGVGKINVYEPGKTAPSKVISNTGFQLPYHMAFNRDKTILYVCDKGNHTVKALSYPSGSVRWTLTFAFTNGVAAYPAATP